MSVDSVSGEAALPIVDCAVHWMMRRELRPGDTDALTGEERARAARLRRPPDQARFVLATALLRRVVGEVVGEAAERIQIDRRCDKCGALHGRPRLPSLGLHASITHSGEVIGIALTRCGPVGLDVEKWDDHDLTKLRTRVLASHEVLTDRSAFYRYWTRKEAVVKATGDGIGVGMADVVVTPPDAPPELLSYPDRFGIVAVMADLSPVPEHPAAVAVLAQGALRVVERWHRA